MTRCTRPGFALCALLAAAPLASTAGVANTDSDQPAPVVQAIEDLARRQDAPVSEISVISREEVTWPNGGLGCPKPGMVYIQQLINGSRLILAYGGREFAYHAGPSGEYKHCANPSDGRQAPPANHRTSS